MELVRIIDEPTDEPTISISDKLRRLLLPLSPVQQLSKLLDLFQIVNHSEEHMVELVSGAWDYLQVNKLWSVRYATLEDLKQAISYDTTVKLMLERHDFLSQRM